MSVTDILALADIEITKLLAKIENVEDKYFRDFGEYLQFKPLLPKVPKNGLIESSTTETLNDKPSDVLYCWNDLPPKYKVTMQKDSIVQVSVDSYKGENGYGFLCTFDIDIDGVIWRKAVAYGPEAWMGYDWQEVTDGTI